MMARPPRIESYLIVSPVKDEQQYLATTVRSVISQTVVPSRWIIVDDGSRDHTASIASSYAEEFPWITVLALGRKSVQKSSSAVIRAFAAGYKLVRDVKFDLIVKLDCDLDLPPNYFERLLAEFRKDETLGIASGVYLENRKGKWKRVRMPEYHAAGASKVIRAQCFQDIGGFIPSRGWDTIDEIRAQIKGWKTRHFEELKFYHLKNEGRAVGFIHTNLLNGEAYYLTGGGKLFFLLKALHRTAFGKPFFLGGFILLLGFLKPWLARRQRLVNDAESCFYQQLLNRRIVKSLRGWFDWVRVNTKLWSQI